MKRQLPILIDTLHTVSLAVWLGGLTALAVMVLPGAALPESLRRLGIVIEVCGILMVGLQFLTRRRFQRNRTLFIGDGVRQLLTFGALLLAESCRYSLVPVMQSVEAAGKLSDFHRLRYLYTLFSIGQVALLVAIGALTAWLQLPRATAPTASASPPIPNPLVTTNPKKP